MERRPLLSSLSCGLLCLALLLAVVGLPLEPEAPEPPVRHGEGFYFPAAAHPGKPVHVETAHAVQRTRSAVPLYRQIRGALLPVVVAHALPAQQPFPLWLAPAPRADRGIRRTAGARAPPFA